MGHAGGHRRGAGTSEFAAKRGEGSFVVQQELKRRMVRRVVRGGGYREPGMGMGGKRVYRHTKRDA